MITVARSNSLPLPTASLSLSPLAAVQPLDAGAEFLDRHGVLRRSSTVTRRMLMRGTSVGSFEFLQETELESNGSDTNTNALPPPAPLSLDDKLALERAHHAKMLRRKQLVIEIRDRKRQLLLEQHARILERLQFWHEAQELDPAVELTRDNTVHSPSAKAHIFIDEDGNLRRKSVISEAVDAITPPPPVEPAAAGSGASSPSAAAVKAAIASTAAAAATIAPRRSLVFEFMQIVLED